MNRRNFVRLTGTAALAAAAAPAALGTLRQETRPRVAVFLEPGFPSVHGLLADPMALQALPAAVEFLTLADLPQKLSSKTYGLFILPYGSCFPVEAWEAIYGYLREGGNWLHLGGAPMAVPVVRSGQAWHMQTPQTQYHKLLGITQAFPVSAAQVASYAVDEVIGVPLAFTAREVQELYVRLANTRDFPSEDGPAGTRDALLRPVATGLDAGGRRIVAPVVEIDRLEGPCAGGRWLLATFDGRIEQDTVHRLAERAWAGSCELTVRPSYGSYFPGETPAFTLQLRRPAEDLAEEECTVVLEDESGDVLERRRVELTASGAIATGQLVCSRRVASGLRPGLYRVKASLETRARTRERHVSGFWIHDRSLLGRGKPFTAGDTFLLRDGEPYPVTGTTYMGSDVHRKFLLEPNAAVWDTDFAAMKKAGINMVRTGIWTGWRNYMLDVGAVNETALRSIDAFILTAKKYDIPVIFTFFAFLPEMWNGENPYLDPRSVSAQKQFLATVAQRYRDVPDLVWDLINEPSFCSPKQLWMCRPNYDRYEREAWTAWLGERYPGASPAERKARLQEIFRGTPEDAASLPSLEDFNDAVFFEERRPLKAVEYRLFAQAKFTEWVRAMTAALRSNGNPLQLVTVGQDEGGTADRPAPHFYAGAVGFTCLHNWWMNDDLVWDSVMTKAPGTPNLVEETGVMFYERVDGRPWRTEAETRALLERKLAVSLSVGGAGFIQWIWNTNPYMKSDNEAGIGLHRADGTVKPELEAVAGHARFFERHRRRLTGRLAEDVVMVVPHSLMFSVRNMATEATRRCVRAMTVQCRMPVASVSEYTLDRLTPAPRLLVVPSPRVLSDGAWSALLGFAARGSTVLITGPVELDAYWRNTDRMAELGLRAAAVPVAQEELVDLGTEPFTAAFRGDKLQKVERAVVEGEGAALLHVIPRGPGKLLWMPLPVELSDDIEAAAGTYARALDEAGLAAPVAVEPDDAPVVVLCNRFRDAELLTLVSESGADTEITLTSRRHGRTLRAQVPAQRAIHYLVRSDDWAVIDRTNP